MFLSIFSRLGFRVGLLGFGVGLFVFCSCAIGFVLHARRRAVANVTATTCASFIHATREMYNPSPNNKTTHCDKRMPFHLFFTLLPLHGKESYRKNYHSTTSNNHTCYTIHIQPTLGKPYLDKTHTSPCTFLICLLFDMRRRATYRNISQATPPHPSCMLQHTYTIRTRKFDSTRRLEFLWPFILIRYMFLFADHRRLLNMLKLGFLSA